MLALHWFAACRKELTAMLFIVPSEAAREVMTDTHEKDIADQIDREVAAKEGLLALVVCLSVTVGLAAAGVLALLGTI